MPLSILNPGRPAHSHELLDREVRRLGRTIARWRDQIVACHRSHVSNGPTEAVSNLAKYVNRVADGMRNLARYRIQPDPRRRIVFDLLDAL